MLDSGVLTALAEGNEAVRVAIKKDLTLGASVLVPSAVLAESLTGNGRRDARVNATLKRVAIVAIDEKIARAAAVLRHAHRLRRAGTIDAIVVATADRIPGTRLLTTDADNLRPLAAVHGRSFIFAIAAP